MSVRDEKLNELAELLGFDSGLARAMREAQAETEVEEIQRMIDEARAIRVGMHRLFETAPQQIKDMLKDMRVLLRVP